MTHSYIYYYALKFFEEQNNLFIPTDIKNLISEFIPLDIKYKKCDNCDFYDFYTKYNLCSLYNEITNRPEKKRRRNMLNSPQYNKTFLKSFGQNVFISASAEIRRPHLVFIGNPARQIKEHPKKNCLNMPNVWVIKRKK